MKNLIYISSLFLILTFIGCTKEKGCTDINSDNYNPDAEVDNGTCEYSSSYVFWYGKETSDFLINSGKTSLTYYVDDVIVGSSQSDIFWTNDGPTCGQNASITVTKNLGIAKNKSYTYKVIDQFGFTVWDGVINFTANTCTRLELSN
jgi:hypothetical protein